jgi:hypothetical protein
MNVNVKFFFNGLGKNERQLTKVLGGAGRQSIRPFNTSPDLEFKLVCVAYEVDHFRINFTLL